MVGTELTRKKLIFCRDEDNSCLPSELLSDFCEKLRFKITYKDYNGDKYYY